MATIREVRFFGDSDALLADVDVFMKRGARSGTYFPSRQCYDEGDRRVYWRYLRDLDDAHLVAGMQITHMMFHYSVNPVALGFALSRLRSAGQ